MKKFIALGIFLSAALVMLGHGNEKQTATLSIKGKTITVDYFSPHLEGRDLQSLVKPGMEWRIGADAPTKLTTDADLKFGSVVVPKGTYTLVAKNVAADKWELVFSADPAIRGTRRDATKDVASVPLTLSKAPASVEHMSIELKAAGDGAMIGVAWGTTMMGTSFTIAG
jgi:hypothetical protein